MISYTSPIGNKTLLGFYKDMKNTPLHNYKRAGVFVSVEYTTPDKGRHSKIYLFSVQTGSVTEDLFIRDFGGHVEENEHPLDAALREFREESLGVFNDYITDELLQDSPVHQYKDNIYIFITLLNIPIKQIIDKFTILKNTLPENTPECLKETEQIIAINRTSIFKNLKLTHHVKNKKIYYGNNLWKTIRAFVYIL
jgi:hypothetical protein